MPPIAYIKEAGHTVNQTINIFKKEYNKTEVINKVCYCGRLDPMARGLLYLLVGDECKDMPFYNNHNKEYEFEIIFGLSTDTDDTLGIITNMNYSYTNIEGYVTIIKDYIRIGAFEQEFHNYSSKRINGKSLWELTKNNIYIVDKPKHKVEIFKVSYNNIKIYNFQSWKDNVIDTINKIDKSNDFRQDEIIKKYNEVNKEFIENNQEYIYSLPITINVSSGFYVRQLVADIKNYINFPILTFDINRTKIFS
jgi:tRNA pseudouridine(55) synthase